MCIWLFELMSITDDYLFLYFRKRFRTCSSRPPEGKKGEYFEHVGLLSLYCVTPPRCVAVSCHEYDSSTVVVGGTIYIYISCIPVINVVRQKCSFFHHTFFLML